MEIKGSAVKATPDFVKSNYYNRYNDWVNALPEPSRYIIEHPIYATTWYPLMESTIIPTQKVAELFFGGDNAMAAREIGRFSSDIALKGMYKIFVRISSPQFVLSKAYHIFATYYQPSDIKIIEITEKRTILLLSKFHRNEELIMERIAGWIEHTLEITLKSPLKVEVEYSTDGNNLSARITATWD
ncbi:MAG: hypothetical protein H6536_05320 [Bacteroidales bacterium]|nr:hypothetical protein [Bacteroidales bacterium]